MTNVIKLKDNKELEEFYLALVAVVDEKASSLPMATVVGVIEMLKFAIMEDYVG